MSSTNNQLVELSQAERDGLTLLLASGVAFVSNVVFNSNKFDELPIAVLDGMAERERRKQSLPPTRMQRARLQRRRRGSGIFNRNVTPGAKGTLRALTEPQIAAPSPAMSLDERLHACIAELHRLNPKMKCAGAIEHVRQIAKPIFNPHKEKRKTVGQPAKHVFNPEKVQAIYTLWLGELAMRAGFETVPTNLRELFREGVHVGRGWWQKTIRSEYPEADTDFIKNFRNAIYRLNSSLREA